MNRTSLLNRLAEDLASVVSSVDAEAEHDRWQAGIGPFEKPEREMLEQRQHLRFHDIEERFYRRIILQGR